MSAAIDPRSPLSDFGLAEAFRDESGARVYLLLPTLDELLGVPGFGRRDPIFLPGRARPLDGWALFGLARERGLVLH